VASVGRDLGEHLVDSLHAGRDADHPAEAAELAQLAAQPADLPLERDRARQVGEQRFETRDVDRLDQVVRGRRYAWLQPRSRPWHGR
jgi:hypothetical protein